MNADQLKILAQDWFQRAWMGRLDKRLPVYAMLLVLLLLTQSLASLTWRFVPVPELDPTATVGRSRQPSVVSRENNQPLAGKIVQWHLFGQFVKYAPKPDLIQQVEIVETRLNLKLRGVFASANPLYSSAIISDAKGTDESYNIGDALPGGVKLHQIFSDRVILDRDGRLETLKLPVDLPPSTDAASSNSNASRDIRPPSRSAPASSGFTPSASADASETLRGIRDALVGDPQSVMGLVRAEPFNKNGRLAGYRIRPGKDRQLLNKFGLRSGDVVTAINGVPMDNPLKALELMRDLKTATSISVDIERRGVPQSFSFQF